MNLQAAYPLRQARPRAPLSSRIGALAVTAAAHLLVVAALIQGLRQADIIRQTEVMVEFHAARPRAAEAILPPPQVPLLIDASEPPAPVIAIAPELRPAPAAAPEPALDFKLPPMQLPSPPNSAAGGSNARATWETALLAKVAAAKRYPAAAKAARLEGVVLLRFAMDRDGKLQNPRIEKSSGHAALDAEALAALARAAPLPRPPADVAGEWLDLIVPVDFF